jgi:exopolysaccharide production protein ExoQ
MNTISTATASDRSAPGLVPARHRSLLRYLDFADPFVFFGWVVCTSFPSPWAAPLRYLIVSYIVVGLVLHARRTFPTLVRAWPAFIIPVLAVISMLWAPVAGDALRKAIFISLAIVVAVYAASRMSTRQILTCCFAGEMIGALLSVATPNPANGAWTGVFDQKNYLALHMFILYAAALVLFLDSKTTPWLRLSALFGVLLSGALIVLSRSGTTTILMVCATLALIVHALLWQPAARVRHLRGLLVFGMTTLTAALALIVFGLFQFDAMSSLLDALGKDPTLTGRTFIWEVGHRVMNEHPLTGVGANGFWRPEIGAANEILRYFDYESYSKFSFHNSYIENGVQYGYPGYFATYFLAGWGLLSAGLIWFRNQTLMNAAFLTLAVMVLIRSNAEIDLASELGATAVLFYIGALRGKHPLDAPPRGRPAAAPSLQLTPRRMR